MNHVVRMSYLSNSFSSRRVPTSPAKTPREMSSGESSPPYEPSQPGDRVHVDADRAEDLLGHRSPFVVCNDEPNTSVVEREGNVRPLQCPRQRALGRAGGRPARARLPRAAPEPRARLLRAAARRLERPRLGAPRLRRAARRSSPTSARCGSRPRSSPAGRSTRSTPSWSRRCEDPGRARDGVPRQRQDDAALAPPGAPGHGRDGGDRERARRGRDRPPPAAARRRAHGAAAERLPLLRAARRSRRRAARPDRPPRRRRDPAVPARRRRDDRAREPGADRLHAPLRAARQAPLPLDGVVTTVDAQHGLRHDESVRQAAAADRLVVTKTDLADPAPSWPRSSGG